MNQSRTCQYCGDPFVGRIDKKFCTPYCKSAWHYEDKKGNPDSFFRKVEFQLKKNRRILATFNKSGKSTIRKEELLTQGFNPRIFTHYWKATNGNTYLFVYEYGFMSIHESNKEKYSLVHWQDYMNDQIRFVES